MRKIFLSISIIFCGVVLCSANLFGIDNTNSEKKLEDESSGIRIRVKSVFDAVEIDDDSFYAEVNGMIKHIYATDNIRVHIKYSLSWEATKLYIDPKYNNSSKLWGVIITLGYGDLFFLCVKTKNEYVTRFYDSYSVAKEVLDLYID